MEKSYTITETTGGVGSERTCIRISELPGNLAVRLTIALGAGGDEMRIELDALQWASLCSLQHDLKVRQSPAEIVHKEGEQ